jgi:Mn2+/Fe2+ NRAMP family transporter
VINGVVAVPVMVVMMKLAARADIMGPFVVRGALKFFGWAATVLMAVVVAAMLAQLL